MLANLIMGEEEKKYICVLKIILNREGERPQGSPKKKGHGVSTNSAHVQQTYPTPHPPLSSCSYSVQSAL